MRKGTEVQETVGWAKRPWGKRDTSGEHFQVELIELMVSAHVGEPGRNNEDDASASRWNS